DIKTESARAVAANFRRRQLRKQIANVIKNARVGCGITARRASDWRLIDDDRFLQPFVAVHFTVRARPVFRTVPNAKQRAPNDVVDECALARTAHASEARHQANW